MRKLLLLNSLLTCDIIFFRNNSQIALLAKKKHLLLHYEHANNASSRGSTGVENEIAARYTDSVSNNILPL